MEFLLSFLILALNLFNYEYSIGKLPFFLLSAVIIAFLFIAVNRKTKNFLTTCLILMCYTWQISWINIFGAPTSELQLPWFYVIGVMILAYGVINIKDCFSKVYGAIPIMFFIVLLIVFNYPLLISQSISNGLKEYMPIGFFVVVLFICYLYQGTMSEENYEHFKKSFIWAVFISSAAIIFQYIMYKYARVALFKIEIMPSYTGYQTNCYLLMEDHSSATIMLGCAIFYILEKIDKKRWAYMVPTLLIVIVSMALTARRTSTVSLIMVLAVYVILHYRGFGKKIIFVTIAFAAGSLMLYYLLIVRPVESLSQIIDDNGRITTYINALNVFKEHPFGIGYDVEYLVSIIKGVEPHNTVLRWLCLGGFIFTGAITYIIGYSVYTSHRKKALTEFWAILYTAFASNFIPDILNARFFVILCSVVFLLNRETVKEQAASVAAPKGKAMPNGRLQKKVRSRGTSAREGK